MASLTRYRTYMSQEGERFFCCAALVSDGHHGWCRLGRLVGVPGWVQELLPVRAQST